MNLRLSLVGVCLLLSSFALAHRYANSHAALPFTVRFNETATRVQLKQQHAEIALNLDNQSPQTTACQLRLEWLDRQDKVHNQLTQSLTVAAGTSVTQITFPFDPTGDAADNEELLWYRLRYQLTPTTAPAMATGAAPVNGIIALSTLTADLFDLRAAAGEIPVPGKNYSVHVITAHPLTGQPVGQVRVQATLALQADTKLTQTSVTNRQGIALLQFRIPAKTNLEDAELQITGERGGGHDELEIDLNEIAAKFAQVLITTDKPLYQPGQMLHTRALTFDFAKQAIAEAPVEIKIEDPEGTTIFRTTVKTSRFGVASADWAIPANARLGQYNLIYELDGEQYRYSEFRHSIIISRYDLPNFTVQARAEHGYHLPGETATVKVQTDYLFGQPVKHASVRIVREAERHWNYGEQKWDNKEEESFTGTTDEKGGFTQTIDLSFAHNRLKDHTYQRFEDVHYAAYVTDTTTGRTEQRRFDVRVTRAAIHLYVIDDDASLVIGQPLQFYLAASYADGTPAQCEVQIQADENEADKDEETLRLPSRKVRTNAYGVAKVSSWGPPIEEGKNRARLRLSARDATGKTGQQNEDLRWYRSDRRLRVETNQTLYRAGEALEISITGPPVNTSAMLTVGREAELLHSQNIRLRKGHAFVVVPYRAEFKDELSITVAGYTGNDEDDRLQGSRSVLYPRNRELQLAVRLDQTAYRPGDEVNATVRVQPPAGAPVAMPASVLGVSVIDQAVLERARTNNEFGQQHWHGWYDDYYYGATDTLGGITKRSLAKLDLTQPLPKGMALVAEILLRNGGYRTLLRGGDDTQNARQAFGDLLSKQFHAINDALRHTPSNEHPTTQTQLDALLRAAGIQPQTIVDPWGVPFRPVFSIAREKDTLAMLSAGSDKRFDTEDDFIATESSWKYFENTGQRLTDGVQQLHQRLGTLPATAAALQQQLKADGFDIATLRDRWGNAYRLESQLDRRWLVLSLLSAGPNGKPEQVWQQDDFAVWGARLDYFSPTRTALDQLLARYFDRMGNLPQNESEWQTALRSGEFDATRLRDLWGQPLRARFQQRARFNNNVSITFRNEGLTDQRMTVTPVTQQLNSIALMSNGPDGKADTRDDFELAEFIRFSAEASSQKFDPQTNKITTVLSEGSGAISGTVADSSGAVILNAFITIKRRTDNATYQTRTDENGKYLFRNLPTDVYEMRCGSAGFKSAIVTDVPVRSTTLTEVNFTLEVGQISEMVAITSDVVTLQTQSAERSETKQAGVTIKVSTQVTTPRLREYFPESLLWQPEVVTDKQGRAQLKFKLADNITTWKLAVIASTADGQIGMRETDVRAFQPFFIEHDPPRVLTEGDEIHYPVVLRNYLTQRLALTTSIKPESWFTLLSPAEQKNEIAAGEAGHALFKYRANASVDSGKQRVTALGSTASDAIEKPVTVHPDGEECALTVSEIYTTNAQLKFELPADTIQGSARSELKIYPNLFAHAFEGIEGLLQRPYGCGEQTISSTYPNLLVLQYLAKREATTAHAALQRKAQSYLQAGYERLLSYQTERGGFAYWSKNSEADMALTGYALRFLNDAATLITVDESVRTRARRFLLEAQQTDGSWLAKSWHTSDLTAKARTVLTTALIARSLAEAQANTPLSEAKDNQQLTDGLARAFAYLRNQTETLDEPYAIAQYALALQASSATQQLERPLARLRQLARTEASETYWALEVNTPFYGWGLPGRIETTALAVQALARAAQTNGAQAVTDQQLANRGLQFLLRKKDRYGVWYSTQATVNVHNALLALLPRAVAATAKAEPNVAEILVDQQRAGSLTLPTEHALSAPLTLDLARFVTTPGAHVVELRHPAGQAAASAQIVTTYYRPWPTVTGINGQAQETPPATKSSALRLAVRYDKTALALGTEVACNVEAERIGHEGYGMMLAEIGLPPGAETNRASLEAAMKDSGWSIQQYDILPDRVVLYLWPRAGGVNFTFKFRPRFGLKAKSTSSVLSDYYNPEARVTVAPTTFVVR